MPAAALLGSRGSALVNSSHGTLPWGPSVCSCRLQTRPRRPRQQHVARASDSPAAPAAPAPPPSSKRPALKQLVKQAWQLLQADALLLRRHLWAVLVVYSLKDVASFVLHRISHKLTNTVAQQVLAIPSTAVGNPWWITLDGAFLETYPGYQVFMGVFFLLTLPLNLLLDAAAIATATTLVTTRSSSSSKRQSSSPSSQTVVTAQVGNTPSLPPNVQDSSSSAISSRAISIDNASSSSSSSSPSAGLPVLGLQINTQSGALAALPSPDAAARSSHPGLSLAVTFRGPSGAVGCLGNAAISAAGSPSPTSSSSSIDGGTGSQGAGATSNAGPSTSTTGGSSSSSVKREKRRPWDRPTSPSLPTVDLVASLKQGVAAARAAWAQCSGRLAPLWRTDLLLTAWSLPLQALSLAVLPAFWTLPKLLGIQLTMAAAVLAPGGQLEGKAALERSQNLMQGYKYAYVLPYVLLIAALRGVDSLKQLTLAALPVRWWQEVVEVPVLITAAFSLLWLLVARLQDLLPVAAYLIRVREERHQQQQQQQQQQAASQPVLP